MMNPGADGSSRDDCGTRDQEWILAILVVLFLATIPLLVPAAVLPKSIPRSAPSAPARDHHRVVLFIVDGLGTRRALAGGAMPFLRARIPRSAFGVAEAPFPTITSSGLRTIISGHHITPEPEFPGGVRADREPDSVLARAAAAGLNTIVVGQFNWPPLFDGHGGDLRIVRYPDHVLAGNSIARDGSEPDGDYDVKVLRSAAEELSGRRKDWDLLVLHLFESDPIGHKFGTLSEEYRTHLLWVDRKIQEISDRLQSQAPTTFLLLADHGQDDDGSHGGTHSAVTNVPFMLWGDGIRPGSLGHLWLGCAAPTLTVLMGLPPPALADRWPALDAIQLNEAQKAATILDLLRQRSEHWKSAKAVWPWMGGDPYADTRRIEALIMAGKNAEAARLGMRGIQELEAILAESSPERWLGRFIAGFWCIVSAVLFNMVWPQAGPWWKKVSVVLAVVFAGSLLTPLQWSWLWPTASACALGAAALLLLSSLQSGYRVASGIGRGTWLLLALCIAGLGMGSFVDIQLWAWATFLALLVRHVFRHRRINASAAIGIVALLICAAIAIDTPTKDYSFVRLWLPNRPAASISRLPWDWLQWLIIPALCVVVFASCLSHRRWRDWRLVAALAAPMCAIGFAVGVAGFAPAYALWTWIACAASLVLATTWVSDRRTRAVCLSLAALAFHRTMAGNAFEWSALSLAVLAVWGLFWDFAERHVLFEGLFIVTAGFWVYGIAGEDIAFAHITMAEGQRLLGKSDYPSVLAAAIALKHLVAFGLAVFPWLGTRPFRTTMGALPFFGFFAAGNLTLLWWDHFVGGGFGRRLTSHPGYEHCLFGLLFLGLLWALWTVFAILDRLSPRRQIAAARGRDTTGLQDSVATGSG